MVRTMLRTYTVSEIAALANNLVSRSEFWKFGELMLDDLDRLRSTLDEEIWRTSLIPQLPASLSMDAHKRIHSRGELPTSRAGTRATLTSSTFSTGPMPSDRNSLHRRSPGQAICNFWMNSAAARGAISAKAISFLKAMVLAMRSSYGWIRTRSRAPK